MSTEDILATEDFIQHSVNQSEIRALKWALTMIDDFGYKLARPGIEEYIKGLEEEENGRD